MDYRLCTTCARRQECVYRKGRREVFRCEEFEGERPEKREPVRRELATAAAR
ncbi:MAG: hypothetical protein R6V05_15370 [Candidatus Brocadiia bacterium]